jgi:plastocyanin
VLVTANQSVNYDFSAIRGVAVSISGTTFVPAAVTVPVGGVVRWISLSTLGHTVTPDNGALPGSWSSAPLVGASTFQHTFTVAGSFPYHCIPHESVGMKGTVTVTP